MCDINCYGDNSCAGNTIMDGSNSIYLDVNCIGDDACKGNVIIDCGIGHCALSCGTPSSCVDLQINSDLAVSFQCEGYCHSVPFPFVRPTPSPTAPPHFPTVYPTVNAPSSSPSYVLYPIVELSIPQNVMFKFQIQLDCSFGTNVTTNWFVQCVYTLRDTHKFMHFL